MKRFLFNLATIVVGSAIALAILHFFWPQWSPLDSYLKSRSIIPTVTVKSGPLTESLKVTSAKLVPRETFNLSFPVGGTVTDIFVTEGQLIYNPTPLAKIDTTLLELAKNKAIAILRQNQANVTKLKAGARQEDLVISNNEIQASKTVLTSTKKKMVDAIRSAYSDTDDAVRAKTDSIFTDPRGDNPETNFTADDSDLENDIERERKSLEDMLDDWKDEVHKLDTGDNLTKAHNTARENLTEAQEYLDDLAQAVSALSAGGGLSQDTLDTWNADIATARATINAARTTLSTAFGNYQTAGRDLTTTESQYTYKQAGSMSQDIDIAQFQLEEAGNGVAIAEKNLADATLQTPHSHLLVTKIYPKVGELIAMNEPAITLDTPELKLQLDVPEEDMAKVVLGNPVKFLLEAFPDTVITGKIETIEPKEVIKNENTYYRVFVRLDEQKELWRSGMGGTAHITVGEAATTLQIPRSAVYNKNSKPVVQVLGWNGTPEEKEVSTGIKDDSMIEVKNGLDENQEIVLYPSPLK